MITLPIAGDDKKQACEITERFLEIIGRSVDLSLVEYLINRDCIGAHYIDGSEGPIAYRGSVR
jgi:hypothetical protein